MRVLGVNEWGARIPNALFFVITAALVGALGRRMWDETTGRSSAWIYATTLAPFAAANVITPDTCLATSVAAFAYAYWRAEYDADASAVARRAWWLAAGVAVGAGLLTKGPAILVFLPPFVLHLILRRRHRSFALGPGPWLGAAVALALGLAWYAPIVRSLPGSLDYLLDNQAVGRLVGARWKRSPGWAGAIQVYGPTLIAGTLPWSGWWLANARRLTGLRALRSGGGARATLLLAWLVLPLLVFSLASSRLPLYLLPLFVPFALITGRAFALVKNERPAAWHGRRMLALVAVWCVALLGLKIYAAAYPTHRDARRQAAWIAAQGVDARTELVAVDAALNGLRMYGYPELRWVSAREDPYPLFSPLAGIATVGKAIAARGRPAAFVVSSASWLGPVGDELESAGFVCEPRVSSDRIGILLCPPVKGPAITCGR
jgi:4-amino-4-deoxy-L-arabinose transferase